MALGIATASHAQIDAASAPVPVIAAKPAQSASQQQTAVKPVTTVTEEMVLQEIDSIRRQLDDLTGQERISVATQTAAGAVLATIAYGVAHAQLVWLFNPSFYKVFAVVPGPSWINAILRGIMDSLIPGIGLGAVLATANTLPYSIPALDPETLIEPAGMAVVSALGLSMLGASMFPFPCCTSFGSRMFNSALSFSGPLTALGLFSYILSNRQELLEEKLSLKSQLKDARDTLANLRAAGKNM
ncbi:hypothetical protein [Parendozoicomonas haliclonae]|uniref:hypothetical protein n=1 Tax=Parendozoicomonas haliclonae TaxID=1960125 RepID=UPI0010549EE3|nr:hypothetical protein [Parendozoicomonas haliclonae]